MAYSIHRSFRPASKDRLASRYRQAVMFVAVIIVGMIISAAVNAIPSDKDTAPAQVAQTELEIAK